ncbi:MAG TPA: hypothetical protein VK395_22040 [Gemmataceae bacterium]|nr:hypothetical protein [Gemmataceae bacterium]
MVGLFPQAIKSHFLLYAQDAIAVTLDLEALQVFGKPDWEAQDFEHRIHLSQQRASVAECT